MMQENCLLRRLKDHQKWCTKKYAILTLFRLMVSIFKGSIRDKPLN